MKKIFVLILAFSVLLSACGPAANTPNNSVDSGDSLDDSNSDPLPPDNGGTAQTPIINLPGAVKFQDQPLAPGEGGWSEGNAFVNSAQLAIMESFPIQVMLTLEGELPTPCNKLTVDIAAPDADNNIHLKVYSLVSAAESCIQMIEPFSENISLPVGDLADGTYQVFVNGELVGAFTYPGG